MNSPAVHIENLRFQYPGNNFMLFNGLQLEIAAGSSFGLFGPNGAGKTTLMSLMTGIIPFQSGTISLLGSPVTRNRKSISDHFGLVPQDFSFYGELSPLENLEFFGAWSGLRKKEINLRSEELLGILGLEEVKDKPVNRFSGGMKRRVNLAIGVIHHPPILFLDEPTVGVDVQTRHAIIAYLKNLNHQGTTLVYTSHQLSEAEQLCDEVALIDEGRIIARERLSHLLSTHRQDGLEGLFLHLTGKAFRD